MTAALRYEWRRITSIRSTWILLVLGIGLAVAFALLLGAVVSSSTDAQTAIGGSVTTLLGITTSNPLVWAALGTIAAQTFGQEYRHGTIRLTLTAFPQRDRIFWAKAIVACAVIGVGMAAALVLSVAVMAMFGLSGKPVGELLGYGVRSLLNLIGFCLIVFGITLITRVLALGIIIPIVFSLVFEGIIMSSVAAFASGYVGAAGGSDQAPWYLQVLPFRSGNAFATGDDVWLNGGVYLVWIVVITGIGYLLFRRRDA